MLAATARFLDTAHITQRHHQCTPQYIPSGLYAPPSPRTSTSVRTFSLSQMRAMTVLGCAVHPPQGYGAHHGHGVGDATEALISRHCRQALAPIPCVIDSSGRSPSTTVPHFTQTLNPWECCVETGTLAFGETSGINILTEIPQAFISYATRYYLIYSAI